MPPAPRNHTLLGTKRRILNRMRVSGTGPSKEELISLKQRDENEFLKLGDRVRQFLESAERANRVIDMSNFTSLGWTKDRPPMGRTIKREISDSFAGGLKQEANPISSTTIQTQKQNQVAADPKKIVYPDAQKFSIILEDDEDEPRSIQKRDLPYTENEVPVGVYRADRGHVRAKRMVVMTFHDTEGFLVAKPVPINIFGEHIEMTNQDIESYGVTQTTLKGIKLINETKLAGRIVDETLIFDLAMYVWTRIPEKTRQTWPWLSAADAITSGSKFTKMEARLDTDLQTVLTGKFVDFSQVSELSAVQITARLTAHAMSNQVTKTQYNAFLEQLKAGNNVAIKKAAERYVNVMARNHLEQFIRILQDRANDGPMIAMPFELPGPKRVQYGLLAEAGTKRSGEQARLLKQLVKNEKKYSCGAFQLYYQTNLLKDYSASAASSRAPTL